MGGLNISEACELCGGDEQVQEVTIYGGYMVNFLEGRYPIFYKMDVSACHVCLDGVLSTWSSMRSAAANLRNKGKETTPASFHEVKSLFTYTTPKGTLEDTFRAFMSQTLNRRLRLKPG